MSGSTLKEWLAGIGRTTLGIVGSLIMSCSAFVITYAAVELSAPGLQVAEGLLWGSVVAASILVVMGGLLAWKAVKGGGRRRERRRLNQRQEALLEQARHHDGLVTVAEAALKSRYTVDEIREQLEAFVDSGVAEPGVSQRGREVYVFPEFTDDTDRLTARTPLEDELEVELEGLEAVEQTEDVERETVRAARDVDDDE